MNRSKRMTSVALVIVAVSVVALTACGSAAERPASTPATASGTKAAGSIAVSMSSDGGCMPSTLAAAAGHVTFSVTNAVTDSELKQEFELVSAAPKIVLEEFFTQGDKRDVSATLEAGTYQVICGASSNPRGTLTVTGATATTGAVGSTLKVDAAALQANVDTYTAYVDDQHTQMVAANDKLAGAIAAGNLELAKSLYMPARVQWERIEPVAELFPDSDAVMDSRADDFPLKEKDPAFTGWHRIEYIMFAENTLDGAETFMTQLQKDIHTLVTSIAGIKIDASTMVNGSAGLIEEASSSKITGEEERYAKTDLLTLDSNVQGSREIVDLNAELLKGVDPDLYTAITKSFDAIDAGLSKYENADGTYQSYDKLTDADRAPIQAELAALSENLSKVAAAFGLEVK